MLTKKIQPEGQADESQRQGPLKLQECCSYPHHPHPPRASMTTILPLLPDHLRDQALRLLAQLSEHGRYTGKASGARRVIISISPEKHIRVPKSKDREEISTSVFQA